VDADAKRKEMLEDLQEKKEGRRKPSSLPQQVRGFPRRLTGTRIVSRRPKRPPRNKPCPCGSGRKYKKCCGAPDRLQPKVKAVRQLPPDVIPGGRAMASDGLPLVATPRDLDPLGDKDIVTAEEIERKHEELVQKTLKESKDVPTGEIVIAKR